MKTLWKDNTEFIGVELTPEEAAVVHKVLASLSFNDTKRMGLSPREQDLVQELWVGLG